MANDLILKPDFTFSTTPEFKTLITKFENGIEQRRPKWTGQLKSFKLVYENRPTLDLSTIQTLFTNKLGSYSAFTWTNPETSATHTVRFKNDSLTYVLKAPGIYDFEFELVEVK
ncbi:MAG: DUF2460 domain-containing protein [Candidatus Omnitrophica bacterium]|nr:DUF2460 domain-containing protein [Candidatus Omnitrophota bacterium]